MRRGWLSLICVWSMLAAALVTGAATASAAPPTVEDGHGLSVVATNQIDQRQIEYTVTTDALEQPVRIRVVLPNGYDPSTAQRYGALYLYHGTSGAPADWISAGDLLQTTAGEDVITILPESGYGGDGGGWFVNWWNGGRGGAPQWETFIIDQVTAWVDSNFKTLADRDHRAVAGLSQGGFGAMHAAARHPDMFTSVASFSGAPEIYRDPVVRTGAAFVIEGTTWVLTPGNAPFSAFGDALTNGTHWAGHDPGTLVDNLRGMDINLWTATGIPGELDSMEGAYGGVAGNVIELLTHYSTNAFHAHLRQARIGHHYKNYVWGTHTFAYWAQDLREYMPKLLERFAQPSTPAKKSYMSIEPAWTQWGYDVSTDRTPMDEKFTAMREADAAGFTFTGTGMVQVETPAVYNPGKHYRITISTSRNTTWQKIRADRTGRLTISLNLGRALLPADLSSLGLPLDLGKLPDTVAKVAIAS